MVLNKGDEWYPIFVELDIEVDSAFDVELMSLLVAIIIAGEKDVKIFTDCKSAIGVVTGGNRGNYAGLLAGWKVPKSCQIVKVKAHPERLRKPEGWSKEDKGIWIADQVAGRTIRGLRKVRISEWLKKIGHMSGICVANRAGVPYTGDMAKRWSKHFAERYFKERDDYREERGATRKWEAASMVHSYRMMGKGPSTADRAAVQRLALDKRWRWHWARGGICVACGKNGPGISHPLRKCKEETTVGERALMGFKVRVAIDQARRSFKPVLEEIWRNMEAGTDGEYACCGVFTRGFLSRLTRADAELGKEEKKDLDRVLKVIGSCTRELLRKHGEVGKLGETLAAAQQTRITQFMPSKSLLHDEKGTSSRTNKKKTCSTGGKSGKRKNSKESQTDKALGLSSSTAILNRFNKEVKPNGRGNSWVW